MDISTIRQNKYVHETALDAGGGGGGSSVSVAAAAADGAATTVCAGKITQLIPYAPAVVTKKT